MSNGHDLNSLLDDVFTTFDLAIKKHRYKPAAQETGMVKFVGRGIALIDGLPGVKSEELIIFPGNIYGMVFNLDPEEVGVIILSKSDDLEAGSTVTRTGKVMDVPVGEALLGRVVDPTGRALDHIGQLHTLERKPIEREAPAIMDREPVTVPLQTGLKVVDALIPIGRGQRELILGDRQTGKTAIALDTIINQKDKNVVCVYCAIGQRSSSVAKLIEDLRRHEAMEYTIVVSTSGEDPPGMKFIAPYAATTMAEYFMERGRDVLIVYDDLTNHAIAYRELSLLLRRPPGREAFPGDVFYIHSRLLERSTHLKKELGGGSLTALPIVATEAQNVAAYIPTNIISITDGQIYLSPDLFRKGILPAVDVGKSVSRVGGKTQLPVYRSVAGNLRLSYSQFEELEKFARFSTRLDEQTRKTLERGRRVREVLKQDQYKPLTVSEQIAVLLSVTEGVFDDLPVEKIEEAEQSIRSVVTKQLPHISEKIHTGDKLCDEDKKTIVEAAKGMVTKENRDNSFSLKLNILTFFLLMMTFTSIGCINIGPHVMKHEWLKYNNVISHIEDQQNLLNLVKLRYNDSPKMLAVTNINSQLLLGSSDSGLAYTAFEGSAPPGDIFSFSLFPKYEDKPTITYQPLQGEKFVKNILEQISLDVLVLLNNSGWSVERIFRLCVQDINGIQNAPGASGPTPDYAPEYKAFFTVAELMRTLQKQNFTNLEYEFIDGESALVFSLAEEAFALPETHKLLEMLRLTPKKTKYPIRMNDIDHNPNLIRLRTRSVMGLLYYLSQSVEVPQEDVTKGKLTTTKYADGRSFYWSELFSNLFQIKSSSEKPSDAFVSIKYRGSWFYIDDTDVESKRTYSLFNQIFAIQAGKLKVERPILTLPIGR
ncbi:MAG: alternate F1F0 ATPase, F1 subunit alpha [Candidatus Scalindua sp. AMX11]|nr:MAG: alternate F1F0 ATPase, F1 subunit alpha [Candidatus Scalindua sp.]NOG84696.1 alternate F1F0 ATPase, F1 subunit alpha [Planctomycetota bacterium]RZV98309.1 MAG: alternate F1F0 ATPase, F1 subunit alpha [Candidatus Scalindua sp. SCAELEC01]TDE66599.1 MAG: alternate F1F0 ATPase, F1 subunit alpha [Candidatus Scalindua sp. AMX11]GJQ58974.1 MAG: hypothetical protein SCALA701_17750 [Candidatus Scalindua sp.]